MQPCRIGEPETAVPRNNPEVLNPAFHVITSRFQITDGGQQQIPVLVHYENRQPHPKKRPQGVSNLLKIAVPKVSLMRFNAFAISKNL
jgi:hypothetical protein